MPLLNWKKKYCLLIRTSIHCQEAVLDLLCITQLYISPASLDELDLSKAQLPKLTQSRFVSFSLIFKAFSYFSAKHTEQDNSRRNVKTSTQ